VAIDVAFRRRDRSAGRPVVSVKDSRDVRDTHADGRAVVEARFRTVRRSLVDRWDGTPDSRRET
jgi:hypothetical protein